MDEFAKGIEAKKQMEQNRRTAKRLENLIVESFYGGHHPNSTNVHDIVKAFLNTREYQVSDESWIHIIVMNVMERLG